MHTIAVLNVFANSKIDILHTKWQFTKTEFMKHLKKRASEYPWALSRRCAKAIQKIFSLFNAPHSECF